MSKFEIDLFSVVIKCWEIEKQVRKEKLGDRIAALQQLVSPFGKVISSN